LPTNIKVPKPTAAQLLAFIGATKVTGGSKFWRGKYWVWKWSDQSQRWLRPFSNYLDAECDPPPGPPLATAECVLKALTGWNRIALQSSSDVANDGPA